jgi:NAD-dependent deacetylase
VFEAEDLPMDTTPDESAAISEAARLIRAANRVVALTGAGISTESGIPDFRGPQGVWTKDPEAEKRATLQHYVANRDARVANWKNRIESTMWSREPNAGHRALADLHARGKLELLVTQNVDGLHQKGGFPDAHVVEIHGTVHEFQCLSCPDRGPIERVLDRVRGGDEDPHCRSCGGILKSATISFGQNLVMTDLERAQTAAATCDLILGIGSTLAVFPAASMVPIALQAGARLIVMNAGETEFDRYADVVLRGQLGTVLPQVVAQV